MYKQLKNSSIYKIFSSASAIHSHLYFHSVQAFAIPYTIEWKNSAERESCIMSVSDVPLTCLGYNKVDSRAHERDRRAVIFLRSRETRQNIVGADNKWTRWSVSGSPISPTAYTARRLQ